MKSLHPLTFKILDWLSGGYLSDLQEELRHNEMWFNTVAEFNKELREKLYAAEHRIRDLELAENKKPERIGSGIAMRHLTIS